IIHETTAPYTPQQNSVAKRKNRSLKEWAVVRLPYPKRKTLSEKGIDCIFVGYAKHSKAYRFYVIEPNDFISINSIIESRDLYLVEGSRDQVGSQYYYCYSIEEDPRIYDEAMQSRDAAFWKEVINEEIGSIMKNNTLVLYDLPPGCKPLGFTQKEEIDYFDTYAPVARITTIRLLLDLAAIHNLVIHQIDVKIAFLNGDLDEEVYVKQLKGFVIPGNEHNVCKLVKSLYGLKQAPKTDHNQVDKTKKFLSSRFSMKDIGEVDVILGIKIKRKNKGIVITQSHYIKKILKKSNREDCSPVSTPMDLVDKLKPNTGKPIDQLEYSRAIGGVMYAMTSTRPDIAYAVGRLSRFISNPSRQHWKAITRVFKYLRYASWINHVEDSSSTSGWVFLLVRGAISWASKKQTCITGSTMESEFEALDAAGKEA
ncbi:zinc finger, CCHC-type containing protein, partial [Tanacetum coccineum]